MQKTIIFSHPDYTVGFGISPNRAKRSRAYRKRNTAGGELHPALKIFYYIIYEYNANVNTFILLLFS